MTVKGGHVRLKTRGHVRLMTRPREANDMERINASGFKAQCLSLLDNLGPEGIVITKRGKAVARVIPVTSACAALIGSMKGRIKVNGDILSTGIRCYAESGNSE